MLASTTQIQITRPFGTLRLLVHIARVRRQLARCPGLISVAFHPGWRTLTVWENAEALKAFRDSGAHLEAMRATRKIGIARTITWPVDRVPSWPEAIAKLDGNREG